MEKDNVLQAALTYLRKYGFSVIPIRPDKKPYIKWERFQKFHPTEEEIKRWWTQYPNANVGIVTGKISGVSVIDVDSKEGQDGIQKFIPESLIIPTVHTPRGGQHLYFKSPEDPISNKAGIPKGCDFRGEGGYLIAPPSKNGIGKQYEWIVGLDETCLPELPEEYYNLLNNKLISIEGYRGDVIPIVTNHDNSLQSVILAEEGYRDHTIFHLANFLARGGCPEKEAFQYLEIFAKSCNPTFPLNEVREKIKSAMKRDWARTQNLAQWVRDWISVTNGYFSVTELYNSLQNVTSDIKANIRQILHRLCKENPPILERHPSKNGVYRRIDTECEEIDFLHASDEPLNIQYPLGIEKYFQTLPKNIIVVAGSKDAGKTAFLLNLVRLNMDRFTIYYFSSEMGAVELRRRLQKFGFPLESWRFTPKERSRNFADVIRPDDINIVDYLEVDEDFYRVGGMLREIYEKLRGGIAIIALQKNKGRDTGVGGDRSLEKPRLYVSLEDGKAKIVVAKNWATEFNPAGLELDFKLVQGHKFIVMRDWHRP